MTIVLKDAANVDVPFNFIHVTSNGQQVFEHQVGPLVGRARLYLSLSENTKTNRIKWKLSVPKVCTTTGADGCDVTTVLYTQISSGDLGIVRSGTEASREDFNAMSASLAGSPAVSQMVVNGIRL